MFGTLFNGFKVGCREIATNPARSSLTVSGIVLGVAALVTTISIVTGMFSFWDVQLRESGGVELFTVKEASPPASQQQIEHRSMGLTNDDVNAIRKTCGPIAGISGNATETRYSIRVRGRSYNNRVQGVEPDFFTILKYTAAEGRLLSQNDVLNAEAVIVLSAEARANLFPDRISVVGDTVQLRGQPYTVVGVLQNFDQSSAQGQAGNSIGWKNTGTYIPVTSMQRRLRGVASGKPWNAVDYLDIQITDIAHLHHVVQQVENTLLATHGGIKDFRIDTKEAEIERINESRMTYFAALGGVGAISLIVGGLGIMNVMLASVSDRLREIGIRKAVGASDMDIFLQVVVEAATLSLLGGLAGMAMSIALVDALKDALEGTRLSPILSSGALAFGFGFSVVVGLLSGIYPAAKAARLDPIEALRYE